MPRSRPIYAILVVATIGAGLASRSKRATDLPEFVSTYAGDTLWALLIFLLLGLAFPRLSTRSTAIAALVISFSVEASQLHQGEWINQLRASEIGALILGKGFLWSDLLCYSAGIAVGAIGEFLGKVASR